MLDTLGVKATFFVCGTTAEKYPDAVRAAREAGHEIAGMSYSLRSRPHRRAPRASRRWCARPSKVLQDISGAKIKGWRCPDYRVSPQTLDILSEEGFAWD